MTIERLTEPQFDALIELTNTHRDSSTYRALFSHLVLGHRAKDAYTEADISQPAMSQALKRLTRADAAARRYIDACT